MMAWPVLVGEFDMQKTDRFALCAALIAAVACGLPASAEETQLLGYSPARETTVTGTIDQVVTGHSAGSPSGLHLLVNGSQGVIDASLGSYLTAEAQKSLTKGAAVQLSGVTRSIDGTQYLLTRTLSVAGNSIKIRNEHGFLIHPRANNGAKIRLGTNASAGGAQ
jgi:hypothetical protein